MLYLKMNKGSSDIKIDGFRFITNVHTTARQLAICSQIIIRLGNNQIPRKLLKELLTTWSLEEERKSLNYRIGKGKITNNGKETSTLRYYLDLANSLGLITHFNNLFSNARISHILLHFILRNEYKITFELSLSEKIFYLFVLFSKDADGILLAISVLVESEGKTQIELQRKCKEVFNKRLIAKQDIAPPLVKEIISEKYRTINFIWKRPEKYAEHILSPRLEWLASLGLVEIQRRANNTFYHLTKEGIFLYNYLPHLAHSSAIKDIDEKWFFDTFFQLVNDLYPDVKRRQYSDLSAMEKKNIITKSLPKALNVVKTSNSFRFPLLDSLLFICMDMFITQNIVPNMDQLLQEFVTGCTIDNKQYFAKEAARINESYISTRIVE